jgi:hypothetical protein
VVETGKGNGMDGFLRLRRRFRSAFTLQIDITGRKCR